MLENMYCAKVFIEEHDRGIKTAEEDHIAVTQRDKVGRNTM